MIEGRLSVAVEQAGYKNFCEYVDAALSDKSGDMANFLIAKLTTNFTYFMREEAHYRFMQEVALPEWTAKIKDKDLRTWSAGCSSGEEAYTTAITIMEYLGSANSSWDTTVLATDISPRVLAAAKAGIYPIGHLEGLPPHLHSKYFINVDSKNCRVGPELAKHVVFSTLNLMDTFKFKRKFHIIFCRNVMIYFDNSTKSRLAAKFYDVLEPGGYLFIGLSETLSGISKQFTSVKPAIYTK
ncbi:MAG: protein-glutamate O-methyltransferase CheR [Clostridiales bacterium]|nr:protein-glutamate O-methyltransferase CheR [Clostridiales bacterium]